MLGGMSLAFDYLLSTGRTRGQHLPAQRTEASALPSAADRAQFVDEQANLFCKSGTGVQNLRQGFQEQDSQDPPNDLGHLNHLLHGRLDGRSVGVRSAAYSTFLETDRRNRV